jgi:hypothetical protein
LVEASFDLQNIDAVRRDRPERVPDLRPDRVALGCEVVVGPVTVSWLAHG